MQNRKRVLEVLKKARERVARPGGWRKHGYGPWQTAVGPVCAVGAIKSATRSNALAKEAMRFVASCIDRKAPEDENFWSAYESITNYNDRRGVGQAHVVKKFDCAIEKLEAL